MQVSAYEFMQSQKELTWYSFYSIRMMFIE